jgi:tight adherence protein B
MTVLLSAVLVLAAVLLFRPPGGPAGRFRRAVGSGADAGFGGGLYPRRFRSGSSVPVNSVLGSTVLGAAAVGTTAFGTAAPRNMAPGNTGPAGAGAWKGRRRRKQQAGLSLTLVVQQLAALLKGGRTPARLWDELWLVHTGRPGLNLGGRETAGWGTGRTDPTRNQSGHVASGGAAASGRPGATLSPGSLVMLGAARAAAFRGQPVSEAIRGSVQAAFPPSDAREARVWSELAACFDIAEASGCPLADVLARFAAQLEVEDDAEAARQTALAGPKATVSLLTWLPLMGLGLGMALGVDPLAILVGTPLGLAALVAGAALTVAGRIWSARLVRSAAGAGAM